jgi:hypothetical protein
VLREARAGALHDRLASAWEVRDNRRAVHETGHPGDSALERKDFLAVAAATLVTLVAPRVALASNHPVSTPGEESWAGFIEAARDAITKGVEQWASSAGVAGGEINGGTVFIAPGALNSEVTFLPAVEDALFQAGAPGDVSAAFAGVSWEGWRGWVTGYNLSLADALRSFVAVPGPEAPPTPLAPVRLKDGTSHGSIAMSAAAQRQALLELLKPRLKEPGAMAAIKRYAKWYEKSFDDWFQHTTVQNLIATGPVPSFAPPYVPVGPVVRGEIFGSNVLDAPAFGLLAGS